VIEECFNTYSYKEYFSLWIVWLDLDYSEIRLKLCIFLKDNFKLKKDKIMIQTIDILLSKKEERSMHD